MKWLSLLLLFSIGAPPVTAQQEKLDSLLMELNKNQKEDTVRLKLLNDIAYTYYNIDPEKGLVMANLAMELAKKIKNSMALAEAYRTKSINQWANGEDSIALTTLDQSFNIYTQLQDMQGMAKVYINRGMVYNSLSDYPHALENQEKALKIFRQLNDTLKMAQALNGLGITYLYLSNFPESLNYYLQAQKLFEALGEKNYIANVLTNIGLVYTHLNNYNKALEYHRQAVEIYKQKDDKKGLANALGNIGNIYDDMDSSAKAIEYYQRALVYSKTINSKRNIASNLTNIGVVYNGLSDYKKALEYLKPALLLNQQLNDKNSLSLIYNETGKAYAYAPASILKENNITRDEQLKYALQYQKKGLQLAQEIGALDRERAAWEALSHTYEMQNNPLQALQAFRQSAKLKDSILNDEKKETVMQLQMQYEFDKKQAVIKAGNDKKHALAMAEISRQKIITATSIVSAVILLSAIIIIFIFYKRRKTAIAQRIEAELKAQVTEFEMKALRAQMNPHFIFNSLNSINDYIDKNAATATLYTTKFAKLMRMILENSEQKEISLGDELKALELYIQLEALRMNDKFSYEIKVDKDIDKETTLIPPLLLQPFVENSIWHGISKKNGKGTILIHIKKEGEMIRCIVEDNGAGRMDTEAFPSEIKQVEKRSLGMKITKARIDIMNKVNILQGSIEILDLSEGTRAEVKLPLELSL